MKKELNKVMLDSRSLEADNIDICDKRGRYIRTVTKAIAAHLVDSGCYYVETTSDISFL